MAEIAVASTAPFEVEVMVYEEDTYLVLGAGNVVRETPDTSAALIEAAAMQDPFSPGDVHVKGSRWYAVVHDFDADVSLQDEHIDAALDETLRQVAEQGIAAIGLQALGSYHGTHHIQDFVDRLQQRQLPDCLQRIWVITKEAEQPG